MNKYLAELIGTFALVFCGTGAVIIDQQSGGIVTHVGIAITFGLIVMAMIYALGDISGAGPICGASMNPARSIAPAIICGHTEHLWIYIAAPILGAAFAIPIFKILHYKNNENANSTV